MSLALLSFCVYVAQRVVDFQWHPSEPVPHYCHRNTNQCILTLWTFLTALALCLIPCLSFPFQRVVDFQWHPSEPWTMLSVSDDNEDDEIGGGSLQMWRINDIIYRDEQEVLAELEAHRWVRT